MNTVPDPHRLERVPFTRLPANAQQQLRQLFADLDNVGRLDARGEP